MKRMIYLALAALALCEVEAARRRLLVSHPTGAQAGSVGFPGGIQTESGFANVTTNSGRLIQLEHVLVNE